MTKKSTGKIMTTAFLVRVWNLVMDYHEKDKHYMALLDRLITEIKKKRHYIHSVSQVDANNG